MSLVHTIARSMSMETDRVAAIIRLLEEGNTIPFIARYRKSQTGNANDTQLRELYDQYSYQLQLKERKETVLRLMKEKEVLTSELSEQIAHATSLSRVEDIYRPFVSKQNTRAAKAQAQGLEPLAKDIWSLTYTREELEQRAHDLCISISHTQQSDTGELSVQEVLQGAMDICAQWVSDEADIRKEIKDHWVSRVCLHTTEGKKYDPEGVYTTYASYTKTLTQIPSYAYLAICRAEKEKQLRVKLTLPHTGLYKYIYTYYRLHTSPDLPIYMKQAIQDACTRLIFPSIFRHVRSEKKEQADRQAIAIFGKNVVDLLLSPPCKDKVICAIDPAYRTGCKTAIIDAQGALQEYDVIYPTKPQQRIQEAEEKLHSWIQKYQIDLICIGNGTGSRETERFVSQLIQKHSCDCSYMIVSEAGASVYSASALAQEEYPDIDVTIRGAINIAQRVQDPLATYVKIDPKSLGVGQYQHDVDQKLLREKLDNAIQDAVNTIGVDVSTASRAILQHIAGLSSRLAKEIVKHREKNGPITSRKQLLNVAGIGPKTFQQCAGFLRIPYTANMSEPLDATGIHPECYDITYRLLDEHYGIRDIILPCVLDTSNISYEKFAERYGVSVQDIQDIFSELADPGQDPRPTLDHSVFKTHVMTLDDIQVGMTLTGVVRNIVDFGCFVDIGIKNDGLVHVSEYPSGYASNPFIALSLGQTVTVTVSKIDVARGRVSLSMKQTMPAFS